MSWRLPSGMNSSERERMLDSVFACFLGVVATCASHIYSRGEVVLWQTSRRHRCLIFRQCSLASEYLSGRRGYSFDVFNMSMLGSMLRTRRVYPTGCGGPCRETEEGGVKQLEHGQRIAHVHVAA